MTIDNLATLKDDMIAFIEGHGMRYFPALIPEDTPRVWWNDPEPTLSIVENTKESWKDFVEMAKTAGAPLVCIGEDTLDKTMVELLVSELQEISGGTGVMIVFCHRGHVQFGAGLAWKPSLKKTDRLHSS